MKMTSTNNTMKMSSKPDTRLGSAEHDTMKMSSKPKVNLDNIRRSNEDILFNNRKAYHNRTKVPPLWYLMEEISASSKMKQKSKDNFKRLCRENGINTNHPEVTMFSNFLLTGIQFISPVEKEQTEKFMLGNTSICGGFGGITKKKNKSQINKVDKVKNDTLKVTQESKPTPITLIGDLDNWEDWKDETFDELSTCNDLDISEQLLNNQTNESEHTNLIEELDCKEGCNIFTQHNDSKFDGFKEIPGWTNDDENCHESNIMDNFTQNEDEEIYYYEYSGNHYEENYMMSCEDNNRFLSYHADIKLKPLISNDSSITLYIPDEYNREHYTNGYIYSCPQESEIIRNVLFRNNDARDNYQLCYADNIFYVVFNEYHHRSFCFTCGNDDGFGCCGDGVEEEEFVRQYFLGTFLVARLDFVNMIFNKFIHITRTKKFNQAEFKNILLVLNMIHNTDMTDISCDMICSNVFSFLCDEPYHNLIN
jgi:hypothetical protein